MKICILYICTGKYIIFWKDFYVSCEKFFLKNIEKHYFVFTDGNLDTNNQFIHRIEQKSLGWPDNTLKRFEMFSRIIEDIRKFDFIFFFNANCEFMQTIDETFLPNLQQELLVVQHPGFFNKSNIDFSYDRNPKSKAYIPFGQGEVYICGGINGGTSSAYCELILNLKKNIEEDEKNNVVALWHDESHMNRYILNKKYKLLNPSYCYPQNCDIPFPEIIRVKDKSLFGGHEYLRGKTKYKIYNGLVKFWAITKKIKSVLKSGGYKRA